MKDAVQRIKKVITDSDFVPTYSLVRVADGFIHATDGRLYVAVPINIPFNFTVPGKDFVKAVMFGDNPEIELSSEYLLFKQGRSRIKIPIVSDDQFPLLEPPPENMEVWRYGFYESLLKVRAFVSENAQHYWAMGAYAHEHGLIATNNIVLVDFDFDRPPVTGLIPFWFIDFLEKDFAPEYCSCDDTKIYAKWEDGSWVRSLRLAGEFPPQPIRMANDIREREPPSWALTIEWRNAYRACLAFADREIIVKPDCIVAVNSTSEIVTHIESHCSGATYWDPNFLGPVLDIAERWDINEYPKPTFFSGTGVRGICVGKLSGRNT